MGTITASKRQLAWVFDLNKCIGCQTCSVACKVLWPQRGSGHRAAVVDDGEHPARSRHAARLGDDGRRLRREGKLQLGQLATDGGVRRRLGLQLRRGAARRAAAASVAPAEDRRQQDLGHELGRGRGRRRVPERLLLLPAAAVQPLHASRPAWRRVRTARSSSARRTAWCCATRTSARARSSAARACPYKKIYFNEVRNVSQHCIGCFPRIEQGVAPACVRQCPGRAAFIGFLDDEGSAVAQAGREVEGGAAAAPGVRDAARTSTTCRRCRRRRCARTAASTSAATASRRRTWSRSSVPTVHGALDVLKTELDRKRRGQDSDLMDALILYRWKDALGHLTRDPADIVWK